MVERIITIIDTLEDWFLRCFFVLIMLVGAYALYDSYCVYQSAQGRSILAYRPIVNVESGEIDRSFRLDDMSAWITVYDTKIDFPIMQGKTNFEYLNKTPDGAYSISGSIFLDSGNDFNFNDDYSLVYGHHMDGEAMFGTLDFFEDEKYFDEHSKGELITRDKTYDIEFFAFMKVLASEKTIFDINTDANREAFIIENAMICKDHEEGRKIIALSTCSDASTLARYVIFGTLKERITTNE